MNRFPHFHQSPTNAPKVCQQWRQ